MRLESRPWSETAGGQAVSKDPPGPAPLPIVGNLYDLTGPTKRHISGHPDGGMHEQLPRLVGE